MTGSVLLAVIMGLGVAVPYARSGKPVGSVLTYGGAAALIGAALVFGGLSALSAEDKLNGTINLAVLIGVLPLFLGGALSVMALAVLGLRKLGFAPEGEET